MTVGRARAVLSLYWLLASTPLILLATVWTVLSKAIDWQLAWSWLGPLIGPQLSIILAVWSSSGSIHDPKPVKSISVFWGTIVVSTVYFFALYSVVFLSPFSSKGLEDLLKNTGWWLAFVQGFANVALGKFFIEDQN